MLNKDVVFSINFFEVNINENIATILETLLFGCSLVIFVFDLANAFSFEKVMRLVSKIDEMESLLNTVKIIIGNKTDLKEEKRYGNNVIINQSFRYDFYFGFINKQQNKNKTK